MNVWIDEFQINTKWFSKVFTKKSVVMMMRVKIFDLSSLQFLLLFIFIFSLMKFNFVCGLCRVAPGCSYHLRIWNMRVLATAAAAVIVTVILAVLAAAMDERMQAHFPEEEPVNRPKTCDTTPKNCVPAFLGSRRLFFVVRMKSQGLNSKNTNFCFDKTKIIFSWGKK